MGASTFPRLDGRCLRPQGRQGLREHTLAWLDTPSGVIVPFQQGGVFTRQQFALTLMPSWLVWKNILDVLPTSEDVELWNELAAATASERVRFGNPTTPEDGLAR